LFLIHTKEIPGIKDVLNPQENQERQKLLNNLVDFRKLLLIYRLIHFKDPVCDINIGLDGRDKELCKPLIQLFYNTKAQKEIKAALQKFLEARNQLKESTIEAALYPLISNLVSQYGNEVSASQLRQSILSSIEGAYDERKLNLYRTVDYGKIYRNSITNIICDKFGDGDVRWTELSEDHAEIRNMRKSTKQDFETMRFNESYEEDVKTLFTIVGITIILMK
jgi:hypothetical protein